MKNLKSQDPSSQTTGRGFSFSTIKIRYRLPLLMGLLLIAVILASTWASYAGVRASALQVANERLVHLTEQLASLLQQQAVTLGNKTASGANEAAIREYVRAPSATTKPPATARLAQFLAPGDPSNLQVEVWSANGSLLLTTPTDSASATADLSEMFRKCSAEPYKSVGTIRLIKDVLAVPIVAAVRSESGEPIGYLVRWRKVASTAESRKQLTELLGSEATLYFGNIQEDIWTDMASVVAKPPGGLASTLKVTEYTRDAKPVMAVGRPINGTPWFIVIEFSRQAVGITAARYLRRMIIIGIGLLLIGVAAAFGMSRSITRPLRSLTEAASMISTGDYLRRVNIRNRDELGTLASAFNTMVVRVRDSQQQLEDKVHERTKELEEANNQLALLSESNVLKRNQAERERTEAMDALRITEQQLQQAQKLEAVGRLAGGISHDFNNLLTAIIGYSDLALKHIPEGSPIQHNLAEIRKASERASTLTRQLLAFSRKQVLQPRVLDLNALVSDLQRMLERMIGEDIELRTTLKQDLLNVKADVGQLEQVIMNLVVNARDALPEGGKITIETANVALDESYARKHISVAPGRYVMLAVSDNGIGMDEETQANMFEPFFTTKEAGKGTGLGLSMVYGIVKQSGGNIWVYSEPQHGTTIKIYLPIADEQMEAVNEVVVETNGNHGSETVLLVEDEEAVRALLLEVLQGEGYSVLQAANGHEAIELCKTTAGKIHLLMTDVVMPGMSGRELVDRLVDNCRNVKVLYMSGYTDDAIVHHGVLNPGVAFLQKPFTPEGVMRKVREVLDSVA